LSHEEFLPDFQVWQCSIPNQVSDEALADTAGAKFAQVFHASVKVEELRRCISHNAHPAYGNFEKSLSTADFAISVREFHACQDRFSGTTKCCRAIRE
jgi:hypothetical protein